MNTQAEKTEIPRTETGALTIHDYEARIHLYREQIGTGYIGIGRTLNEAKEAGVVPHGEWEDWVTRTTGLNSRQAQRCMQAAREIRDGSALARLEMTKALMLLSSGLDEDQREEAAKSAADGGESVRALRERIRKMQEDHAAEIADSGQVIRQLKLQVVSESGAAAEVKEQLKRAKAEKEDLTNQLRATQEAYRKRLDEAETEAYRRGVSERSKELEAEIRKEFQGKIDHINRQWHQADERVRDLQTELAIERNKESTRWDEGYQAAQNEITGLRNEANKQRQYAEELKAELEAAEAREEKRAAEMAEMKRQKAREGMDAARGIGAQGVGAMDLSAAVRDFIGRAGVLPQMGGLIREMTEKDRGVILANIETIGRWVDGSLAAMGVVRADARIQ